MATVRIFARDKYGERQEIGDDLYFFEEEGIHDLSGDGMHQKYKIEIEIDGVPVEITDYRKHKS